MREVVGDVAELFENWRYSNEFSCSVWAFRCPPSDVRALLDECDRLERERDEATALLGSLAEASEGAFDVLGNEYSGVSGTYEELSNPSELQAARAFLNRGEKP